MTKNRNAAKDALNTPALPEQTLTSSGFSLAQDPVHALTKYGHPICDTLGASAYWKIKATIILNARSNTLRIRPLLALGGEVEGLSFPHQALHRLADAEQKQNVTPDITALKVPVIIPMVFLRLRCCASVVQDALLYDECRCRAPCTTFCHYFLDFDKRRDST
jgi:hypothetical protein